MKNFFKNKNIFPYNSKCHTSLWSESRFIFIDSPDELPADEAQWFYLRLSELETIAGSLANELLSKEDEFNELKEKKSKRISLTADEEKKFKELKEKHHKLEKLQKIIQLQKDPKLKAFLNYSTHELNELHSQKSREVMTLIRKGSATSKEETSKLANLREEIAAIALIVEERGTLTEADAKKLEKDLEKKRIPDMETTGKQEESLEQMLENTPERRQEAIKTWRDHIKYIGTLEGISEKINGALKKLQGGSLTIEDKRQIDHIYRSLESLHSKLGGVIDMNELEAKADEEVKGIMTQSIQDIKEHRDQEFKKLLENMEKDFAERIKSLKIQWTSTNLHPSLKAEQKENLEKIKELEEALTKIRKLITLNADDSEYKQIISEIHNSEERAAHRKRQIELLEEKKKKYTQYIERVKDRLTAYDYTEEIDDLSTTLTAEQKKLYKQLSKAHLKKEMDTYIAAHQALSGKSYKAAAISDPEFNKKYYRLYKSIDSQKIRDEALKKSLESTLRVTKDRLDQLERAKDSTLYDEDDHYNLRIALEEQLRNYEDKNTQKFKDAKETPIYEEAPEWSDMRARFSNLYDSKRKIFDRGAPNDEVSPYKVAVKELEEIQQSGIIEKIRKHLANKDINLTDEEKENYEKHLSSIEQSFPFFENGIPSILEDMDLDAYSNVFTQGEPPGDPDKLKELVYYLDDAEKNIESIRNAISETKKLKDNLIRFEFDANNQLTAYGEVGGSYAGGWASISDIIGMYKLFDTSWKRLWERDQKATVGEIGSLVFDLPGLHSIAYDSALQVEQAENEAVNQYKEIYDNMDAWAIQSEIPNLRNKDYLKAAMLSLADKGRLNFESPDLWRVLSKFSNGAVSFDYSHPERETDDYVRTEDKIRRAMIAIWGDDDLFNSMSHTNESNLKSKMESYSDIAAQRAPLENGLEKGCSLMLKQWILYKNKGQTPPGFDPAEYEEYIRYGTDAGKMDPHAKFYYLLQGVRHGILQRKRLGAFSQDFSGDYPVMEFFDNHWPWEQIVEWADDLDGPGPRGEKNNFGPQLKYKTWYHGFLLQDQTVNERLRKIMSEGKSYDHDEIAAVVTGMGDDNMNTLLRWRSSAGRFSETGLQNMAVGMMFGMQVKAMQLNKYPETADKDMKDFIASWIRFSAITGNLMFQGSEDYVRFNEGILNKQPRTQGAFAFNGKTTKFYVNKMNEYVTQLDPFLFSTILNVKKFNEKERGFGGNIKAVVNHLKTNYSSYNLFAEHSEPQTADELFNMMGTIVSAVVNKAAGEGRLRGMIEAVQKDLKEENPDAYKIMETPPPPPYAKGEKVPIIEEPLRYSA